MGRTAFSLIIPCSTSLSTPCTQPGPLINCVNKVDDKIIISLFALHNVQVHFMDGLAL